MRIILGQWHSGGYAGTQSWNYTLARVLKAQGHDVVFYSSGKGRYGMRLLNEGFEHWSIGERLPEADFAIISQPRIFMVCSHCLQTCVVDREGAVMPHPHIEAACPGGGKPGKDLLPKCKRVYVCHGWLEQERPWQDGTPYFAVCKERQDLLREKCNIESSLLPQPVDLDRFRSTAPLRRDNVVALVLSTWPAVKAEVEKAGAEAGVAIRYLDAPRWDIEAAINEVDIVIGTGRGICEAMACGRAALVCGQFGCDGFVKADNVEHLADFNFSGRASRWAVEEVLAEQLRSYSPLMGAWCRAEAERRFRPESVAAALLEVA